MLLALGALFPIRHRFFDELPFHAATSFVRYPIEFCTHIILDQGRINRTIYLAARTLVERIGNIHIGILHISHLIAGENKSQSINIDGIAQILVGAEVRLPVKLRHELLTHDRLLKVNAHARQLTMHGELALNQIRRLLASHEKPCGNVGGVDIDAGNRQPFCIINNLNESRARQREVRICVYRMAIVQLPQALPLLFHILGRHEEAVAVIGLEAENRHNPRIIHDRQELAKFIHADTLRRLRLAVRIRLCCIAPQQILIFVIYQLALIVRFRYAGDDAEPDAALHRLMPDTPNKARELFLALPHQETGGAVGDDQAVRQLAANSSMVEENLHAQKFLHRFRHRLDECGFRALERLFVNILLGFVGLLHLVHLCQRRLHRPHARIGFRQRRIRGNHERAHEGIRRSRALIVISLDDSGQKLAFSAGQLLDRQFPYSVRRILLLHGRHIQRAVFLEYSRITTGDLKRLIFIFPRVLRQKLVGGSNLRIQIRHGDGQEIDC